MKLQVAIVLLLVAYAASSPASLICYQCEDCDSAGVFSLQRCGLDAYPQKTFPSTDDIILTPPTHPGETTTESIEPTKEPELTLPTIPPDITVSTMSTTEKDNVVELPVNQIYVCTKTKSLKNDREVIHRGCAVLDSNKEKTCQNFSDQQKYDYCVVCTGILCNN